VKDNSAHWAGYKTQSAAVSEHLLLVPNYTTFWLIRPCGWLRFPGPSQQCSKTCDLLATVKKLATLKHKWCSNTEKHSTSTKDSTHGSFRRWRCMSRRRDRNSRWCKPRRAGERGHSTHGKPRRANSACNSGNRWIRWQTAVQNAERYTPAICTAAEWHP